MASRDSGKSAKKIKQNKTEQTKQKQFPKQKYRFLKKKKEKMGHVMTAIHKLYFGEVSGKSP